MAHSILGIPAFKLTEEEDFLWQFKRSQHTFVIFAGSLSEKVIELSWLFLDTFQKCAIDALVKIGMNLLVLWQIPEKKNTMQTQAKNLKLCPWIEKLDYLCSIKVMLISQMFPFIFIIANVKGVSRDLRKIQTVLPRCYDNKCII